MKKIFNTYLIFSLGLFALLQSCKKENAFLDAKPNKALAVPSTLADLQGLIHNSGVFNEDYPVLGEVSTDDYYVTTSFWESDDEDEDRNAYIWAKNIFDPGANSDSWSDSYTQIYYANTVLDYLPQVSYDPSQQPLANQIKGSALFFRSIAFYNLVQTFALPYDPATAATDLGIPLKLSSDLNEKIFRSTEQQCYQQILTDLQTALTLLPKTTTDVTQPSQVATYALLSRINLVLGNFPAALQNASSSLAINHTLQDFNQLDPNAFPVYPHFSPEELFHSSLTGVSMVGFHSVIDSNLYRTFNDPNDLRLAIFFYFDGVQLEFNSQFDIHNNVSNPISNNEVYLNKAECEARAGDTQSAMQDLNTLLITRWKTGTFKPYTATTADDALNQILLERRKELVFTGLRWTDLRRLNKDPRFAVTLTRHIDGNTYTLPPNDPRYALPIPPNEVDVNGLPQNGR